jgi:predicted permease
LLVRGFWNLQQVQPGMDPSGVLTTRVSLSNSSYDDPARLRQFWSMLSERLAAAPGVESSTIMGGLPPQRSAVHNDTEIENFAPRPGGPNQNVAFYQSVGDRFFETMGIRLVDGRFFDTRDGFGAPPVVIVNQTMARTFWPGESALGKRIRPSGRDTEWMTVVGVIADVKNAGLDQPVGTEIFMPARQGNNAGRTAYATVKVAGNPRTMAGPVREAIRSIDPTLPVAGPQTMDEVMNLAQSRPRFLATMLTIFSGLALALAAFGIYGVISYSVTQRTTEFGIRMALGARPANVLGIVMRQGIAVALAGIAVGALGAAFLTRWLEGLLFGVSQFDTATFAGMAAVLGLVTVLASWVPAHRATAVDPVKALKYE